jgi:hypothetical protein
MAPAMEEDVRFRLAPSQTGLFDETAGTEGIGFTSTANEDEGPVQPFTVAFTEYVPDAETAALLMTGF